MSTLVQQKVHQATGIMKEKGVDAWLTFVRETSILEDPVLPLIYGLDLTWQSVLILTPSGDNVAIVGQFEAEAARGVGAYPTILPYNQSIQPMLLQALEKLNPRQVAINYSVNDDSADGLTYGMYQLLQRYLEGTPFADRLISAEGIISALRGRKTPEEIERVRAAVATTEQIFRKTFDYVEPGMTERQIADFMHAQIEEFHVEPAWQFEGCPIVNAGPNSPVGHSIPTDIRLERGQMLHLDFGIKQEGYCSDLQRVLYFLAPGETQAPGEVRRAFQSVAGAIQIAMAAMNPGRQGKEIDEITRKAILSAGYPEFMHATGHQLGRSAHDGAGILGPEWERYGDTPNFPIEADQIYAVEPGVPVPGYGHMGLEEDVLVKETGTEYLGKPQLELIVK